MQAYSQPRATPWVIRLVIANAAVLLVLLTLLTSPAVQAALAFAPFDVIRRPWSLVTYQFVHGGLMHLALNMLGLWVFGTPLEQRLGGRRFLSLYLGAGIGAALFTVAVAGLWRVPPFVGASGAILGLAAAYAATWPEQELLIFPIPVPIRARTMVLLLVGFNVLMAILGGGGGIAYEAHVGGAVAGWFLARYQAASAAAEFRPPRSRPERVPVASGRTPTDVATASEPQRAPRPQPPVDPSRAELDRVLDKISATGLGSLTPEERRFLDDQSRRKRGEG